MRAPSRPAAGYRGGLLPPRAGGTRPPSPSSTPPPSALDTAAWRIGRNLAEKLRTRSSGLASAGLSTSTSGPPNTNLRFNSPHLWLSVPAEETETKWLAQGHTARRGGIGVKNQVSSAPDQWVRFRLCPCPFALCDLGPEIRPLWASVLSSANRLNQICRVKAEMADVRSGRSRAGVLRTALP